MSIKFEDTKGVIRSHNSKNVQMTQWPKKTYKRTNEDLFTKLYAVNYFIKVCYGAKTYECTHFTRMILIKFKL
jgi:hypothetical protein